MAPYSTEESLEANKTGPDSQVTTIVNDVQTHNFAGRLGGNQQFTSSDATIADGVRNAPWRTLFDPADFKSITVWKMAAVEGIATCLQTFLGTTIAVGIMPAADATSLGPLTPVAFAAVLQIFLISLFVYSAGPLTGGHLNPLITMATFSARLSTFPRTVLYIVFQCIGAIIGALVFRETVGLEPEDLVFMPGCYADTSIVTPGQAFGFEFMSTFLTLFFAFGLGLDPRNAGITGPAYTPILLGLSSSVILFGGAIVRPGYLGPSMNPARCLGLATASHNFVYHYIHWTGSITAVVSNALLYFIIPPFKPQS